MAILPAHQLESICIVLLGDVYGKVVRLAPHPVHGILLSVGEEYRYKGPIMKKRPGQMDWKERIKMHTSCTSTRKVISDIVQSQRGKGWLHLHFMGFYSVTGDYVTTGVSEVINQKHGS